MNKAQQMVNKELSLQMKNWGLEHDIKYHGSEGLAEAAIIISQREEPKTDGYNGDEWFFVLWHKHKNDPIRRYAIAAAMLQNAIECSIYERGLRFTGET